MIPDIKELENSFERLFGVYLRASDCRSVEKCLPPFLVPMTMGHTSGHSWRLYSLLELNQDSHSHSQQLFCDHHGYHQDHLWSLSINRPYITQKVLSIQGTSWPNTCGSPGLALASSVPASFWKFTLPFMTTVLESPEHLAVFPQASTSWSLVARLWQL